VTTPSAGSEIVAALRYAARCGFGPTANKTVVVERGLFLWKARSACAEQNQPRSGGGTKPSNGVVLQVVF
jgi:hypothetical protein